MKRFLIVLTITIASLALVTFLFFTIRRSLIHREIEAEWQAEQPAVPQLAVTSHLEIIPLYEEAGTNASFLQGHGVSYLIRTDSATILLDVGNNPDQSAVAPFLQNMLSLGIAWDEISRIVISHPHPDHVGGIKAWQDKTVAIGNFELPQDLGERLMFVPAPVAFKNAIHATVPSLPAPDVATTGVISYLEGYPISILPSKGGEQALVVHVAGKGLVLIAGCGHPGLEKLVERAESLYSQPVVGVVGGLHYEDKLAADVQSHIQFLQARPIALVALSPHDSSPEALAAFETAFPGAYQHLAVGESVHLP